MATDSRSESRGLRRGWPRTAAHRSGPVRRAASTAALLLVAVAGGACAYSGEPQQPGFTDVLELDDGDEVAQTFVPRGSPLSRVDVLVGTFEVDDPDAVLRLEVSGAGETRTAFVGGEEIEDAAWLSFLFPPVDDAAGETFTATLSHEGTDPLALFVNRNDPYPDGGLVAQPGDLAFRVGHFGRAAGVADALRRVVGEFIANLRQDPAFAVGWVLGSGALAATGVWMTRSRPRGGVTPGS